MVWPGAVRKLEASDPGGGFVAAKTWLRIASRKLKNASAAYPARKAKPPALRLNPPVNPGDDPGAEPEGLMNKPTTRPAIAPIGKPVNVKIRSRGDNRLSRILSWIDRIVATRVPSKPNIIGRTRVLKTEMTEPIAWPSIKLACWFAFGFCKLARSSAFGGLLPSPDGAGADAEGLLSLSVCCPEDGLRAGSEDERCSPVAIFWFAP